MKIIFYINKIGLGGAERVMSVLANCLAERGHQVTLVTDYSMDQEYSLNEQVERHVIDGPRGIRKNVVVRTVKRLHYLRCLCKNKDADIIVSFIRDANCRALLATMLLQTKNLISVRADPKAVYKTWLEKKIVCGFYRLANGCVFQTLEAQSFYAKQIQEKSRIILNPVSQSFYEVEPGKHRVKEIVTCGRLSDQKNHELLIRAFAAMEKKFDDYKLIIYGEGPKQESLQALINSLNLTDRVLLAGRCNDVPHTILNASLFVLSSDFEGLPNALMEAMALGVPVISTDCSGGGARLLLRDGENGRLLPCKDQVALTKAMESSLSDMICTEQMAKQAYADAQLYRAESVVDAWETYLLEIVS